jgi:hypothetical protein
LIEGPEIHAAWIDVGWVGFVVATSTWFWSSWTQDTKGVDEAVAEGGSREVIFMATRDASDSGWARLVRAALAAERGDDDGGYRDAPATAPDLARVRDAEALRIRNRVAVGVAGLVATEAMAITLLTHDGYGMGVVVTLFAALIAWRTLVNGARARAALEQVWSAREALFRVERPPPPRNLDTSRLPVRLPAAPLRVLFAVPSTAVILALFSQIASTITLHTASSMVLLCFVLAVPLFGITVMMLSRRRIDIDPMRTDLVVTLSVLGIDVSRTCLPLEIVRCARVTPRGTRGGPSLVIDLTVPEREVQIERGLTLKDVAHKVNRALGVST